MGAARSTEDYLPHNWFPAGRATRDASQTKKPALRFVADGNPSWNARLAIAPPSYCRRPVAHAKRTEGSRKVHKTEIFSNTRGCTAQGNPYPFSAHPRRTQGSRKVHKTESFRNEGEPAATELDATRPLALSVPRKTVCLAISSLRSAQRATQAKLRNLRCAL